MFRLFKSKNKGKPMDNSFTVISAEALLQEEKYAKQVKQLKELLSVTREVYQDYYLQPLLRLAALVQHLPAFEKGPYHARGGFLRLVLQRTIVALKYRRSMMLPIGATPEAQYHEHDLWTYAVYTASLLWDCWILATAYEIYNEQMAVSNRWHIVYGPMPIGTTYQFKLIEPIDSRFRSQINLLLAGQLLSQVSLQWLYQKQHVFQDWLASLSFSTAGSILSNIIEQAQAMVSPTAENIYRQLGEDLKQEEDSTAEATKEVGKILNPITSIGVVHSLPDLFINWLKQNYQLEALRTTEGLLIGLPTVLNNFINSCQTQLIPFLMEGSEPLAQVLEQLLHSDYVILNPNHPKGLYQYYLGEWKARNVIEGLIIKPDAVFLHDQYPPLHPDCHLDLS